jgi:hypothetical protein
MRSIYWVDERSDLLAVDEEVGVMQSRRKKRGRARSVKRGSRARIEV